jgi:hypothetical protein
MRTCSKMYCTLNNLRTTLPPLDAFAALPFMLRSSTSQNSTERRSEHATARTLPGPWVLAALHCTEMNSLHEQRTARHSGANQTSSAARRARSAPPRSRAFVLVRPSAAPATHTPRSSSIGRARPCALAGRRHAPATHTPRRSSGSAAARSASGRQPELPAPFRLVPCALRDRGSCF